MKFSKDHNKIQSLSKNNLKIIHLLKRKFAIIITMALLISIFSRIEVPIVYASTTSRSVPTITSQPTSKTVYVDDIAKLKIRAEGTGTLSYNWYSNTNNSTGGATQLRGEASSTYLAPTTTSGTKYYYCIVTNKVGTKTYTTTSDVVKVVVNGSSTTTKEPRITSQPANITVGVTDTAKLKIEAAANGSLSYKWYSNTTNSTRGGRIISSATSSTYSAPTTTTGRKYYYCIVTNKIGSKTYTTTSDVSKVVVTKSTTTKTKATTITTQPNSQTVYVYDAAKLKIEVEGTGTLSYNWYRNTTNNIYGATKISGATSSTYSAPTTATGTKYYYCIVTNTIGTKTYTTTSDVVKVVVKDSTSTKLPTIKTQPTYKTVYAGDTAKLKIEATATGTLSYNWYSNTTNSTSRGTKISGATSSSYFARTSTVGTKYYYCIVTSTIGSKTYTTTSDVVEVVVKKSSTTTNTSKAPRITTQPTDQTVYLDDMAKLKIKATGTGTLSYRWYISISNNTNDGIKIGGATSSTYLPPTSSAGTKSYYCIVTNTIGSKTYTTTSDVVDVVVKR